jgi:hypothetical protein
MKIVTLRSTADQFCPTERTCPSIHDVDVDPLHRYVIYKTVTEADQLAVFNEELAASEALGYMPADFIPTNNSVLDRTRGVHDPALRPDRQYVILTPVTDPQMLDQFAHLIAPDEHLGRVHVHQLLEV